MSDCKNNKENKIACKKEQVKLLKCLIKKNWKCAGFPAISLMLILTLTLFLTTGYETELSVVILLFSFLNLGNVIACFVIQNQIDKLEIEIKDAKYNN